jgi:chromate transport protein ChrA
VPRPSRALGFALVNVCVGFLAVGLATAGTRGDWAALVTTLFVPPLLIVTIYHALRDLSHDSPGHDARVQAWLALLLCVAPALLLGVFFTAAGPAAHGQPARWLPWAKD